MMTALSRTSASVKDETNALENLAAARFEKNGAARQRQPYLDALLGVLSVFLSPQTGFSLRIYTLCKEHFQ
jgi:hypothetical protein